MIPLTIRDAAVKIASSEQKEAVLGIVAAAYHKQHRALEHGPESDKEDETQDVVSRLLSLGNSNDSERPKKAIVVLGVEPNISEEKLRKRLSKGTINSLVIHTRARCAFVDFRSPEDAAKSIGTETEGIIDGIPLWFRYTDLPVQIPKKAESKVGRAIRKAMRNR